MFQFSSKVIFLKFTHLKINQITFQFSFTMRQDIGLVLFTNDVQFFYILFEYIYIFRKGPQIPEIILQEYFFKDLAFILYKRLNQLLPMLLHISCRIDLPLFLMVSPFFSFIKSLKMFLVRGMLAALSFEHSLQHSLNKIVSVKKSAKKRVLLTFLFQFLQNYRFFKFSPYNFFTIFSP